MDELLEQIEQCLYQLKHNQHRLDINIKQAVNEVEIALQNLIRLVESSQTKE